MTLVLSTFGLKVLDKPLNSVYKDPLYSLFLPTAVNVQVR